MGRWGTRKYRNNFRKGERESKGNTGWMEGRKWATQIPVARQSLRDFTQGLLGKKKTHTVESNCISISVLQMYRSILGAVSLTFNSKASKKCSEMNQCWEFLDGLCNNINDCVLNILFGGKHTVPFHLWSESQPWALWWPCKRYLHFIFMGVNGLSACIYVYHICVCFLWRLEERARSSGAGVTADCKMAWCKHPRNHIGVP